MGQDKPIDNSSRKGYIHPDGTIRDEHFIRVKPEEDDNGKYILVDGEKRYVEELVDEHFGKKREVRSEKPEVGSGDDNGGGEADVKSETSDENAPDEDGEPDDKHEARSEEYGDAEGDDDGSPDSEEDEGSEEEARSEKPEGSTSGEAEDGDENSADAPEDEEIALIADIFKANPDFTYAKVQEVLVNDHGIKKISRNKIAEGKRVAGLV